MARQFLCTKNDPVVTTKYGRIRGFKLDSTYIFHGIQYARAKRFHQPVEPETWEGIKDALTYGPVCPMLTPEAAMGELMVPHRYWVKHEECLYLNVWSQSLKSNAKKPVMVWLHGGGFAMGSSIEQVAYEGENMSRKGDVVVVSLNHRLNILGYLDLSHFGEAYANSANAGSADLVAALKWIKENIEHFGGDPDNVTIFGQSGGGMKVWTLLQTPEADGLFHKGIIQSGVIDGFGFESQEDADGSKIVAALMDELGFAQNDVEKLETVAYERLAAAYLKAAQKLMREGVYIGGNPKPNAFYIGDPRVVGFCDHARTIPLLIGTVFGEFAFGPGIEGKYELDRETMVKMNKDKYKEGAMDLIELFERAYPDKNLTDLLSLDSIFRLPTIDFVQKRSASLETPIYSYNFTFEFPYDDGKPAWHCSEIPFVFHNTDLIPICNKPGVSDQLEDVMFEAWMSFARTGNPNHPQLPKWPSCTPDTEAVMIFDQVCCVKNNYDHALVKLHKQLNPPFRFGEDVVIH